VANSWQQVNVSPDFPTTARIIMNLYPQSGGTAVDGVLAIDPPGLAGLLELTGAVAVPGWPEPVTAANVVDVTLRAAYERYPVQEQRVAFLGEVSRRVFEAFTAADLGSPANLARSLGRAARTDHLFVYLDDPGEERLAARFGVDGAVPSVRGDSLTVVSQNVSANKVDLYLRRSLCYEATLDPAEAPAGLTGRLELRLDNGAPSQGLPSGVIGPYDPRFAPGENRAYVSLYSPFPARAATLDRETVPVESGPELGRLAHSLVVSIPSGAARTLRMDVQGRVRLDPDGWYRLDLGHQPVLNPDRVDVAVTVPEGWRIVETRGLDRAGSRRASAGMSLEGERTLLVRVERQGASGFWERLLEG
jgi:Protein of unknown function (DUF4012)